MIRGEYVSRLAAAIKELECARREIHDRFDVRGYDEHKQDVNHIINQITVLIEDHCKQNVGEE